MPQRCLIFHNLTLQNKASANTMFIYIYSLVRNRKIRSSARLRERIKGVTGQFLPTQKARFMGPTWDPKQGSWGQHGTHLGPVGPRWAPCQPHEPCNQIIWASVWVLSPISITPLFESKDQIITSIDARKINMRKAMAVVKWLFGAIL